MLIKKSRKSMIKYLLEETRYTIEELLLESDETIKKWYIEERECNEEDY